eukprot:scaffold3568_cov380-Prasinococcus_capsulatus_cf.AAC.4
MAYLKEAHADLKCFQGFCVTQVPAERAQCFSQHFLQPSRGLLGHSLALTLLRPWFCLLLAARSQDDPI